MEQHDRPQLIECLAYAALRHYKRWLGVPSPKALAAFLAGAEERAAFTRQNIAVWRVHGPLENPEFYMPLVERTGHPLLSIKWVTAMEILHFSLADSMDELRRLVVEWFDSRGFDPDETRDYTSAPAPEELGEFLSRLARRPAMFLGTSSAWLLHCYLKGMDRGGDWLGLPPLPELREIRVHIARQSRRSYGSAFGAYRVYEHAPAHILAWVGILPKE